LQADVLGHLLHHNELNVGLVLVPMFTYKQGSLWSTVEKSMKLLLKRSLFFDPSFSLLFNKKADERDSRPLAYQGRVVLSGQVQMHRSPWKGSAIIAKGHTEPANQVPAKDMVLVEDLGDTALPSSIEDKHWVQDWQVGEGNQGGK
jgi:hypothetical protein